MKKYSRVISFAKYWKYWLIKVGERSELRQFWKKCVFYHKIWAISEIRIFALSKSVGAQSHLPPPPPPLRFGSRDTCPPPSPTCTPLQRQLLLLPCSSSMVKKLKVRLVFQILAGCALAPLCFEKEVVSNSL